MTTNNNNFSSLYEVNGVVGGATNATGSKIVVRVNTNLVLLPQNSICLVGNNSSSLELLMPESPGNGSTITIVDYNGNFSKYPTVLTLNSPTKFISNSSQSLTLDRNGIAVTLLYYAAGDCWSIIGASNNSKINTKSISLSGSSSLSLDASSSQIYCVKPVDSPSKNIFISKDFAGKIINGGNGSIALVLKNSENEQIIEVLDSTTNIKSASIFYDETLTDFVVEQEGIFSASGLNGITVVSQSQNLKFYDKNSTLISDSATEIEVASDFLSINEVSADKIRISANLNGIFSANTLILSTPTYSLNQSSAYFQVLSPNQSDREILISREWVGKIINDGDGYYGLILKDQTSNQVIGELSSSSNIKAASVWYDGSDFVLLEESSYTFENLVSNVYRTTNIKTDDYEIRSGERVLCDCSSKSIVLQAPTSGRFQIVDITPQQLQTTNSITIESSSTFNGIQAPLLLNRELLLNPEFEYVSTADDWIVLNSAFGSSFMSRSFNISGNITATSGLITGSRLLLIDKGKNKLRVESIGGICVGGGACNISIYKNGSVLLPDFTSLDFNSSSLLKYTNENSNSNFDLVADGDYYILRVMAVTNGTSNFSYSLWISEVA